MLWSSPINICMRARQLYEAIRFSKSDYPSLLADPKIRVGYEIEFIAPLLDPNASVVDARQKLKQQIKLLLRVIQQDLQFPVEYDAMPSAVSAGKWSLVQDSTIEPDDPLNQMGWELVSPPQSLSQALLNLQQVFAWMEQQGFYTNNSCGFHVNISYGTNTGKADSLKLILLLGEQYLAQLFDRASNDFAASHLQQLKRKIQQNPAIVLSADTDVVALKNQLRKMLSKEKNYTINLGKQAQKGYLEFRIAGGQGYHHRWQDIENLLLRYAFVVKASLDPNSFKKQYVRELAKLILQARSN